MVTLNEEDCAQGKSAISENGISTIELTHKIKLNVQSPVHVTLSCNFQGRVKLVREEFRTPVAAALVSGYYLLN